MSERRPGIILQARYGSTRLRGKALARLGPWTLLEHCLRRLLESGVGEVVLATTRRPEDDALAAVAETLGVAVHRGPCDDVLARYVAAAERYGLDPIVRATGDNPLVDRQAPARLLRVLRETGADYVGEEGLPVGAAVEAVTLDALRRAAALASDPHDREHVTTFIRRHPERFAVVMVDAPPRLRRGRLSLTVDRRDDLERVRELLAMARSPMPDLDDVIQAADLLRAREGVL
jgi:spore coat polysaccharide biosynthesis protein SpsF